MPLLTEFLLERRRAVLDRSATRGAAFRCRGRRRGRARSCSPRIDTASALPVPAASRCSMSRKACAVMLGVNATRPTEPRSCDRRRKPSNAARGKSRRARARTGCRALRKACPCRGGCACQARGRSSASIRAVLRPARSCPHRRQARCARQEERQARRPTQPGSKPLPAVTPLARQAQRAGCATRRAQLVTILAMQSRMTSARNNRSI